MAILADERTRVLVQGITGHQGSFHTGAMLEFGAKVVAGVTPGKGGESVHGVPVFNTVEEAVDATGANASLLFVPARFAAGACMEAVDAGIKLAVVITEHIPVHDELKMIWYARATGATVIGPNCPGIASPPAKAKVGILPNHIFSPGRVGLISRSGTLTYEIVNLLTRGGQGQSTCIGIGGDRVIGTNFIEALDRFEADPDTDAVALVGEIGGAAEELAAAHIAEHIRKPVFAYIAGRSAPEGKRMGHAGAIITRGMGTAKSKIEALRKAGVMVAETPDMLPEMMRESL